LLYSCLPSTRSAHLFGQQFKQGLEKKTLLVAAQATAHQQKLLNAERLVLERILAASPELNPVECFSRSAAAGWPSKSSTPYSRHMRWWRKSSSISLTIPNW